MKFDVNCPKAQLKTPCHFLQGLPRYFHETTHQFVAQILIILRLRQRIWLSQLGSHSVFLRFVPPQIRPRIPFEALFRTSAPSLLPPGSMIFLFLIVRPFSSQTESNPAPHHCVIPTLGLVQHPNIVHNIEWEVRMKSYFIFWAVHSNKFLQGVFIKTLQNDQSKWPRAHIQRMTNPTYDLTKRNAGAQGQHARRANRFVWRNVPAWMPFFT